MEVHLDLPRGQQEGRAGGGVWGAGAWSRAGPAVQASPCPSSLFTVALALP